MPGKFFTLRRLLLGACTAAVIALLISAYAYVNLYSRGGRIGPTGLKVFLSTRQGEFRLGEPMRFRIVVRNMSFRNVTRDFQQYLHPVFEITDPDGNEVPEVAWDMSSCGGDVKLRPFQSILASEEDLLLYYHIVKEGEYRIKVQSLGPDLPESNELRFTVKGGTVPEIENLVSALLKIAHGRWKVGRGPSEGETFELPGWGEVEGFWMQLMYGPRGEKRIDILCSKQKGPDLVSGQWAKFPLRYVGSNEKGHFYFMVFKNTAELWPSYEADLKKALGIE